jgi:glycolate oxidase
MKIVFRKMEDATTAVSKIISAKIIPSTLEFLDNASIQCVEDYLNMGLPRDAGALLLIEVDGDGEMLPRYLEKIREIIAPLNPYSTEIAGNQGEVETLWKARRALSPASYRLNPVKIAEDITVPRNKITAFVSGAKRIAEEKRLKMINFGHAGDGNIHTSIMIDGQDEDERKRAETAIDEIFKLTIELGGTLSGEHGVGITKVPYIDLELNNDTIETMRKIKNALDPNNILNPGKIFKE